jgi:hypothetical protein
MLLRKLEAMLHELYALEVGYAVSDFLITDAELAGRLDAGGRKVDEKLLIAEADGEPTSRCISSASCSSASIVTIL